MGVRHGVTGWLLLGIQLAAGWLARRHYQALPPLALDDAPDAGTVAVVVPARNEAHRLGALLDSLGRIAYRDCKVVVVDDASGDGTAEIAAAAGLRVIPVAGPPAGWTGKCFACWTGATQTESDWILFTDADTIHGSRCLSRSLATALAHDAGLLSLLARQRCQTFWERLLLPYAYALYFVGALPNRTPSTAVANGQFMLFRRSEYERIGGHAAVRGSVIDDVALARVATANGVRVVLARGEDALAVHMYENLAELWEGFGKNVFRFVRVSPRSGPPTVVAGFAFGAALPAALLESRAGLRAALLLAPALSLAPWQRRFGVPPAFGALYPLAAVVFQLLALDSIRRTLLPRGTHWKGRRY